MALDDGIRVGRMLLDLADKLDQRAEAHAAEYPGAYAEGLEAAAEVLREAARDLLREL